MKVPVTINTKDVFAIVDSGAEVTVLSREIYDSIPIEERPKLHRSTTGLVVAEADRVMATDGIAHVSLSLGNLKFEWPMFVAKIIDDLLLGCDVLDAKDITLNTHRGLLIKGCWLPCEVHRRKDPGAEVLLERKICVPPNSEMLLPGKIRKLQSSPSEMAVLEPYSHDSRDIVFARTLVSCLQDVIPVRIINLSGSDMQLAAKYPVGYLSPVESILEVRPSNTNEIKVVTENQPNPILCRVKKSQDFDPKLLPETLRDLFERSLSHIKEKADKEKLADLLCEYQDVFAKHRADLGSCSIFKHKIDTQGAPPIRQALRRTPRAFEQEEEKYLKEQLDAGVLVPSTSAWASPVVLVRKKDGTVRWCCDFRKLNEVTVKDAYPLPRIDMCLDALGSAQYFSTMDLQSGYWQLQVDKEDQHKTAIITKYGLFEYAKLPMGLCNSPSSFQRCMEMILRGLQWKTLLIYLDDIIVFSATVEEHLDRLGDVLKLLRTAGLKLKPAKCNFLNQEVLFLGHIVGAQGIQPNPQLVAAVKEWKEPCSVKQVQQFLGLCNYYRRFVYRFSEIAAPLTHLTEKKTAFQWTSDCQTAFDELKEALCEAPILAYPSSVGQFIVDTDASNIGIGGVLSQVQNGKERAIWYASKKLSRAQRRYCVTRRELLAVVVFLQEFRHYLLGQEFLLRTDHNSLRWICNFRAPQGQLARWLEVISQYNCKIVHREGKKHGNADALSRQEDGTTECTTDMTNMSPSSLPCGGCSYCTRQHQQWAEFLSEIDDIIPLCPSGSAFQNCHKVSTRNMIDSCTTNSNPDEPANADTYRTANMNWVAPYSPKELVAFQRQDPDLVLVHDWLDRQMRPDRDTVACHSPNVRHLWLEWDNLRRIEGILYLQWIEPKTQLQYMQLIVPSSLQKEFIHLCHSLPLSGHLGVDKTVRKIQQKAYWRTLRQDVKLFIQKCANCAANHKPKKQARSPLSDYRVGHPMDRLGLDILGPLPTTPKGNTCILVIADYFTRWVEAYALPNQTAETIAQTLVIEFLSRFGCPLEIHTDQGRNFQSDLFGELCRILDITKTKTTPYHPASNGLVERFNQTLAKMIRSYIQDQPKDWDINLPLLTAAYRSTVHPATKYTPNFMMLGREVTSPTDLIFPPATSNKVEVPDYLENLQTRLADCYSKARLHLKAAAQSQKKNYDTRIAEQIYTEGDLVYRRNFRAKKLDMPWTGPFVVQKHMGGALYKIGDKKKSVVLHHNALRPYKLDFVPAWARKMRSHVLGNKNKNCE